jgi:hypothetical protein
MTGIPCAHAHSAITFHGHKPKDYVDHFYSIEMYNKAYAPMIYPVPSEEQWILTNHGVLEPLRSRVTPGRPRKARTRAPDESRDLKNPYKIRKFGLKGKCGFCKMFGHNSRTCPKKKQLASNYRQPTTEVELSTPPLANVSLLPNHIIVVVNDFSLHGFGLLTFGIFCFLHHVGVQTQSEGCSSSIREGTNPARNSSRGGAQPYNKKVSIGSHF